jgi:hypothetical protein
MCHKLVDRLNVKQWMDECWATKKCAGRWACVSVMTSMIGKEKDKKTKRGRRADRERKSCDVTPRN